MLFLIGADFGYCLCWYVMSVCCFGFVCVADLIVLVVLLVLGLLNRFWFVVCFLL